MAQSASQEAETVIVTGTRVQGMTAADSAAPITELGAAQAWQGVVIRSQVNGRLLRVAVQEGATIVRLGTSLYDSAS